MHEPEKINYLITQGNIIIDLTFIESFCETDTSTFCTIVQMFLKNMPLSIEQMKMLCVQKNWKQLAQTAHSVKSTLSVIQVAVLYTLVNEIELIAKKQEETATISPLIQQIVECYKIIAPLLQTELAKAI